MREWRQEKFGGAGFTVFFSKMAIWAFSMQVYEVICGHIVESIDTNGRT